ncbi:hypothetical protein D9619_004679 [Psilocybe cf. subviscida]|uniref:Uncharacterized protein n=1 Tax=Psilocybe cf. subviscida TaxID=2480587 RepID=A0A8H5F8K7_9AGAR|nr:hypothetical protein D9619_004679 [Psilocybe cf. subviscida]
MTTLSPWKPICRSILLNSPHQVDVRGYFGCHTYTCLKSNTGVHAPHIHPNCTTFRATLLEMRLELPRNVGIQVQSGHPDFKRSTRAFPGASPTGIVAYNLLWGAGLVLIAALMAFSLRVADIRRRAAWFLVAMSWAVSCTSYLLLVGHQSDTQALPSKGLCLLQASLIYASPSLCTLAMVAFLFRSYLLISRISSEKIAQLSFTEAVLLNAIPVAAFAGILYANIMVGLTHQNAIEPDISGLYCHLKASQPKMITGGVSLIGVAAFYIIFGFIVRSLRRRPPSLNAKNILQAQGASLDIVIRMVIVSSMSVIVVM